MNANKARAVVCLRGITKSYGNGDARVLALDNVSVDFQAGKFTAIMGPSGSGKSTMLNILAGLDTPSQGDVFIDKTKITGLSDDNLTRLRRERIGFIFQNFNLVPTLDAAANIVLPLKLAKRHINHDLYKQVVDLLGIQDRLTHKPSQLSGGQQQRVAIARALVMQPNMIVADEPTGNLDSYSSSEVLNLLRSSVDSLKQSVIMVTHDFNSALMADRVLVVKDGHIVSDLAHPTSSALQAAL